MATFDELCEEACKLNDDPEITARRGTGRSDPRWTVEITTARVIGFPRPGITVIGRGVNPAQALSRALDALKQKKAAGEWP